MKKSIVLMLLTLVCYDALAQQADYNLDFENWDQTSLESDAAMFGAFPKMHRVANPYRGNLSYGWVSNVKVWRTTDAYSGHYALVLNQWYNGVKIWCFLGDCSNNRYTDSCLISLPRKIYGVSGYYKFYRDSTAIGKAKFTLTTYKIDTVTHQLKILSKDSILFTPQTTYTYFNMYVHYSDTAQLPDSVAGRFDVSGPFSINPYNNFLYLDALQLHNAPYNAAGFTSFNSDNQTWNIYPNPAKTLLYLEHSSSQENKLMMYNAAGKKMMEINWPQTRQIDISRLPNGTYYFRVINGGDTKTIKTIVITH
jgi:hypothetical protein